jgi:predicted lipoprotein with Yx(FWY)xxD motif
MITYRKSKTIRRQSVPVAVACLAAATLTLTAVGCSSDSGGSRSAPVPPATGDAVSAQLTSLGTILVDGRGRTVYEFANDTNNMSTCAAACEADWPFVPAPASLPTSLPGVTGALGTTSREGGARQLTVAGHPVYTFARDSAAGQTNGQGITLNGGLWTVVSPAGAPVANPAPAGAATQNPGPAY